jgi:hypothetical protein
VVAVLALLLHWLFIFNLRLAEEEEEAISGIPASCQREDTPPAVKADQVKQFEARLERPPKIFFC